MEVKVQMSELLSAQATLPHTLAFVVRVPLLRAKHMLSTFYSIHRTKLPNRTCMTIYFIYLFHTSIVDFLASSHKININFCGEGCALVLNVFFF